MPLGDAVALEWSEQIRCNLIIADISARNWQILSYNCFHDFISCRRRSRVSWRDLRPLSSVPRRSAINRYATLARHNHSNCFCRTNSTLYSLQKNHITTDQRVEKRDGCPRKLTENLIRLSRDEAARDAWSEGDVAWKTAAIGGDGSLFDCTLMWSNLDLIWRIIRTIGGS